MRVSVPAIERFESRIERIPFSGCWIWMASVNCAGYGQLKVGNDSVPTHRFAYQHFIGEIPAGRFICHRCDVPSCCNPAHLYAGTPLDNTTDRDTRRPYVRANTKKTHCPRGHQYTAENTMKHGANGRRCKLCKVLTRHNGRTLDTHPVAVCAPVVSVGVGKHRKDQFECPTCKRRVWQHMNHLGTRIICCNGFKTTIQPGNVPLKNLHDLLTDIAADISKHGR